MITRKYKFPTLEAYFEHQRERATITAAPDRATDRDTYAKMADRHDIWTNTISRIVNRRADPSYALALAISAETGVALDGMGRSGKRT